MARKALRKTPGAVTGRIGGLFISLRPCSVVPSGCSHNCASCVGAAQQWSNRRCRVMPARPRCCPSPLTLTHWLCCRGRLAFLQSRVAGFVQMRLSSAAATSAGGSSQHMRVRLLLLFFFFLRAGLYGQLHWSHGFACFTFHTVFLRVCV